MNEERIERLACELADELGDCGDELLLKVFELTDRVGRAAAFKSYYALPAADGQQRLHLRTWHVPSWTDPLLRQKG